MAVVVQETEIEASCFLGRFLVRESTAAASRRNGKTYRSKTTTHCLASGDLNYVFK